MVIELHTALQKISDDQRESFGYIV